MNARIFFLYWTIFIHALVGIISFYLFRDRFTILISIEIGLTISIIISLWFWSVVSKSEKVSAQCLDMIKEQDFSAQLTHVGYPEADRMIDVYNRMMTELREQRLLVRNRNQFLDLLIEASPMGIIIFDYDMQITSINPFAAGLLDASSDQLIGHSLSVSDQPMAKALTGLSAEEPVMVEVGGINRYKCTLQFFIDRGFQRPFILVEELTKELVAAERKASEIVIRTMSHEVNNTLSSINSNLSVLLSLESSFPDDLRPDIVQALQLSIERSENLCNLVSAFANVVKIPPPSLAPVNLNTLIENTVNLMGAYFSDHEVGCSLQLNHISPVIMMDAIQMEQVLINILKNAVEASGHGDTVTVLTTDNPAMLMVRDTGHGIPEKNYNQLFLPFFSTKSDGQGIGLMLVREILSNHKFSFRLETLEYYTEFKIIF